MKDKGTDENFKYHDYSDIVLWIGFIIVFMIITVAFCVTAHFLFN